MNKFESYPAEIAEEIKAIELSYQNLTQSCQFGEREINLAREQTGKRIFDKKIDISGYATEAENILESIAPHIVRHVRSLRSVMKSLHSRPIVWWVQEGTEHAENPDAEFLSDMYRGEKCVDSGQAYARNSGIIRGTVVGFNNMQTGMGAWLDIANLGGLHYSYRHNFGGMYGIEVMPAVS